jgi:predicted N-acyltransferase
MSSAHITFIDEAGAAECEKRGWLIRDGIQYHWFNRGYGSFDDFLAALTSRKRKAIRKERSAALEGLTVEHVTGSAVEERHWDAFWAFYQDTGSRKWGRPYLTREFFDLVGERMGDKLLLFLVCRGSRPIAGALNFIGPDTLYGRYWGCLEDRPFLHFEICYYQAIEFAIAAGLARVEAGAQGEHKLARGYLPVTTYSAHWLADPRLARAVSDYLEREREAVAFEQAELGEHAPYRRGAPAEEEV